MNSLESLEKEVAEQAAQMTAEVVLLLIDRWEEQLERDFKHGKITAKELLHQYVSMKISLHRLARRYENDYYYDLNHNNHLQIQQQIKRLQNKVKEARRNYYVAKHRTEPDQHGGECTCRGCRCIKGISYGSSHPVGQEAH